MNLIAGCFKWDPLLIQQRNVLSVLQFWLEKRLGEPAQFNARLQFKRSQQSVKNDLQMSFNLRSMIEVTRNSEVYEKTYQDSNWRNIVNER
jgi:hypothetical protein